MHWKEKNYCLYELSLGDVPNVLSAHSVPHHTARVSPPPAARLKFEEQQRRHPLHQTMTITWMLQGSTIRTRLSRARGFITAAGHNLLALAAAHPATQMAF